jgi:riboflavin kinase/FMN adenylyltransferase
VVAPDRVPLLVYSLPQKLRTIEKLGADTTLLIRFDQEFSQRTGEEFVRALARDLGHIHSICVGSNFTFGRRRGGNVGLLRKLGQELNFIVHGLAAVSLDGQIVSSTRVREAIRNGQLDQAGQMLGRPYSLAAQVVPGDQLGRQLGFPTANLDVTGHVLPPHGVYAVHAHLPSGSYRAVLNLGTRPTLADPAPQLRAEAHILDFDGNVYGQELEFTFIEKLRDEQKFPSLEALQAQIARDVEAAKRIFA